MVNYVFEIQITDVFTIRNDIFMTYYTMYDFKFQVCGMLCYYIVTQGGHPYRPLDDELHTRVKNGKPDLSPVKHDFEACDLISSMLADDPKARPSAEQLRR